MRVLIVGFGSAGRRHAKNARELGHEVVVVELSQDVRDQARRDGFDVDSKVEPFDAAVITTPAATHLPVATRLFNAGYRGPLFVEKPLDVETTCWGWWMQWPHPTKMVGYNWRFIDELRGARAGTARALLLSTWTDMSKWPGSAYASALLECSHDVDLARWLIGKELQCIHASRRGSETMLFLSGSAGRGAVLRLDVASERAWRSMSAVFGVMPVHGYTICPDDADGRQRLAASYKAEMAEFLKAAEAGVPVPNGATFEDGLAVLKIIEQAEESANG